MEKKQNLSLVVIGGVDCGKSTVAGHLIYRCGGIDEKLMKEYEDNSREMGRESFKYAWILNRLRAERERGISINTAFWDIESVNYNYTLIDTPGHRDFLKNMITGTSQGDAALLILDASVGAFEFSMNEGYAREHSLLAFTFGLKKMIVAVNKMDSCEYSEMRFNEIKEAIGPVLERIGYQSSKITFVPISGWVGDNLIERSPNLPWYDGPALLETFENLSGPTRHSDKPLRLPIEDVYKIGGVGTVPVGRVNYGRLTTGMRIVFAPSEIQTEVKNLETRGSHQQLHEAEAGTHIAFSCLEEGTPLTGLKRGEVASDMSSHTACACIDFQAQLIILDHPGQIRNGYTPILDIHTAHVATRIINIDAKLDRLTGNVIEENPPCLKSGDCCLATLMPLKPLVVESFSEYPQLGRFSIRDMRYVVGVGVIKSVNKKQEILGKGARCR